MILKNKTGKKKKHLILDSAKSLKTGICEFKTLAPIH